MSATPISPGAAKNLETLRVLGFKLTSDTGSYRLIRSDGSMAALYSLKGTFSTTNYSGIGPVPGSGNLGNISDSYLSYDTVVTKALVLARAILKDEATRLTQMTPFQKPSLESRPYG